MTVGELRKALEGVPDDMEVALHQYVPNYIDKANVMREHNGQFDVERDLFVIGQRDRGVIVAPGVRLLAR